MTNRQELRPAFFYGRVSTDGQDRELSIGEQLQHAYERGVKGGVPVHTGIRGGQVRIDR